MTKGSNPITRAKLTTILTDTNACQTCITPNTNYFLAFLRLIERHLFSSHRIGKRSRSQHAPFHREGACVWSVLKVMGLLKDHLPNNSINVFSRPEIGSYGLIEPFNVIT